MDRSGLPLPEQVSNLRGEVDQLKEQVNELPTEARVYNMDWDGSRWTVMGGLGAVLLVGLFAFSIHTCSAKQVEEIRIAAHRASDQELRQSEQADRNLAAAEHNVQLEDTQRERATETCTRACTVTHMEMIRPSPCMCGGGGQLIFFSEDYTSLSRVREVERLEAPPNDPAPVQEGIGG